MNNYVEFMRRLGSQVHYPDPKPLKDRIAKLEKENAELRAAKPVKWVEACEAMKNEHYEDLLQNIRAVKFPANGYNITKYVDDTELWEERGGDDG